MCAQHMRDEEKKPQQPNIRNGVGVMWVYVIYFAGCMFYQWTDWDVSRSVYGSKSDRIMYHFLFFYLCHSALIPLNFFVWIFHSFEFSLSVFAYPVLLVFNTSNTKIANMWRSSEFPMKLSLSVQNRYYRCCDSIWKFMYRVRRQQANDRSRWVCVCVCECVVFFQCSRFSTVFSIL